MIWVLLLGVAAWLAIRCNVTASMFVHTIFARREQ